MESHPSTGRSPKRLSSKLPATLAPAATRAFRGVVWAHYRAHGRDLPWRHTTDPWQVLVSEVMLQQTQATRVAPKFVLWMERFPDPASLAAAELSEILGMWIGLGYNRRALALARAAAIIVERHGGSVPESEEDLRALPGVGVYTARAVRAFAFGFPGAFLETNIRAVLIRHFFPGAERVADRELEAVAEAVTDRAEPARWHDALMDYGADLKRSEGNHARRSAAYRPQAPFAGSRRRIRGAILKAALESPGIGADALHAALPFSRERIMEAADMLVAEGLLEELRGSHDACGSNDACGDAPPRYAVRSVISKKA